MSNKILSTLNIGNNSYEIDDAFARQKIEEVDNNLSKINPVYSTSGSVVSFDDGADNLPLEELIVDINPVQDLHGYDHPWIGGGGKNLFDKEKPLVEGKYISNDGSIQSMANYQYSDYYTPVEPDTSYIFSCTYFGSGYNTIVFYDIDKTFLGRFVPPTGQTGASFTTPQDCVYIRFNMGRETILSTLQLEKGSVATDYAPYENICPISGWTRMQLAHTGKNLLAKPVVYYQSAPDTLDECFYLKAGTYMLSIESITGATSWRFGIRLKDASGNNLSANKYKPQTWMSWNTNSLMWLGGSNVTSKTQTITLIEDCYIRIVIAVGDTSVSTVVNNAILEVGDVATEYEPYIGTEIPILWESEAETVYGGNLDVLTGVLTINKICTHLESLTWVKSSEGNKYYATVTPEYDKSEISNMICSEYILDGNGTSTRGYYGANGTIRYWAGSYHYEFYITDDRYTTLADFTQGIANSQICYPLENPITYQLTPHEVKTFLGQNNIFTDINSKNILVSYKADVQKYIDKTKSTIFFGQCDPTSTNTNYTAQIDGITEYFDGLTILLRNGVVNSTTGFTININGLGGKGAWNSLSYPMSRESSAFLAPRVFLFIYDSTLDGGNGGWLLYRGFDANDNSTGYVLRTNSMTLPVSSYTRSYRLLFTSADGTHFVPANNDTTNNTTAIKNVCQEKIDPFGTIRYYNGSTILEAEEIPSGSTIWEQNTFSLGYSFNHVGGAINLTTRKPVYIKALPQSDGSAIIDADEAYVQDLPTTEDGYIYIYLGTTYSVSNMEITSYHPVYYYHNGAIQLWTGPESFTDDYKNKIDALWADYQSALIALDGGE